MALLLLLSLSMAAVLWIFHTKVGIVVTRYRAALDARDPDDDSFAIEPRGTVELEALAEALNTQFRENREQLERNRWRSAPR
jgi:hypothetical protein